MPPNAHVVAGGTGSRAASADGTETVFDLVVGQVVFVVGNRLGLAGTVTAGVVSPLVTEGRYKGVAQATGKALDAQVTHIWDLADGEAT